MPNEVTLAELRDQLRQLTDTENDDHKTDAWLNRLINEARQETFEVLRRADPDFYEKQQVIVANGVTDSYPLPDDHHLTKGVEWLATGGFREPLTRTDFRGRLDYQLPNNGTSNACRYRLVGGNLVLYPRPRAAQTYYHVYVPAPIPLVDDVDTVDGREAKMIVYTAAVQVALKDESASKSYEDLRDRELQRLTVHSEDRASLEPAVIVDVEDFSDRPFRVGRYAEDWRP